MKTILYLILEYLLIIKMKIRSYLMTTPPSGWLDGNKKDVVLVHGWNENWSYLYEVGQHLSKEGHRVHVVIELGRNHRSVNESAQTLNEAIMRKNLTNLILVSHSKGGLISKVLIDNFPAGKMVDRSISIATPYYGSQWGVLRFGGLAEMIPGSKMLQEIHKNKDNHKIVSIRAKFDNHAVPGTSAILEGAENIELPIVGHTRILISDQLMKLLPKLIEN